MEYCTPLYHSSGLRSFLPGALKTYNYVSISRSPKCNNVRKVFIIQCYQPKCWLVRIGWYMEFQKLLLLYRGFHFRTKPKTQLQKIPEHISTAKNEQTSRLNHGFQIPRSFYTAHIMVCSHGFHKEQYVCAMNPFSGFATLFDRLSTEEVSF